MTTRAWFSSSLGLLVVACHPAAPAEGGLSEVACPAAWFEAPTAPSAIAVPTGNERLVLHAAATGSQNYLCGAASGDGGAPSYAWSLTGPEAALSDCHAVPIGHDFASDSGVPGPEWQTNDGAYVVGKKMAAAPTADGVPWLLLSVAGHRGTAPITEARYVQRVRTSGGLAPSDGCDASRVGAVQKVPYTADYRFYAP